jgi:hypothetical protein
MMIQSCQWYINRLACNIYLFKYIFIGSKFSRKKKTGNGSRKREYWTSFMDDALIDAFLHQHRVGNRVGGTFTTQAYDNILAELCEKFETPVDKVKMKNNIKAITSNFASCYGLFKNGLSGLACISHQNVRC